MEYYIKKNDVVSMLMKEAKSHGLSFSAEAYERAANLTACMPNEEVQPIKHGRWEETHISLCKWVPEDEKEEGHSFYMVEMKCSCCERYNTQTFSLTLKKPDFCQHCGARMDGDSNG